MSLLVGWSLALAACLLEEIGGLLVCMAHMRKKPPWGVSPLFPAGKQAMTAFPGCVL